ncbi:MAG: sugar transferase [Candidatus Cloacimonetes bacterium]|nr:sugar transferase [Candidatus Cloacimonadota bacterium]
MRIANYKIALGFMDYVTINFAYALSLRFRYYPKIDLLDISQGEIFPDLIRFAIISIIGLFLFEHRELYKHDIFTRRRIHIVRLILAVFLDLALLTIISSYMIKLGEYSQSRIFFVTFLVVSFSLLLLLRLGIIRPFFRLSERKGWMRRRLVIYGAGGRGQEVFKKIVEGTHWRFYGFVDDNTNLTMKRLIGSIDDLEQAQKDLLCHDVIIAIDNISHERIVELIDRFHLIGLRVLIMSDLYEILDQMQPLEVIDDIPLINLNYNAYVFYFAFVKRIVDLILATVGLIVLLPFFFILGILIKLESRGPAIFTQKRVGKNGKQFKFYKFRSMRADASDDSHKQFIKELIQGNNHDSVKKMTKDPRITPIGQFIRRTSIDELPQLFNVILGNMSLVGPRPVPVYEYEQYKKWHKVRFMIKPGCTGFWQVKGRSSVSYEEMIIMDYFYIHNMSPWFDIKLLLHTIPVMIFGRGAH